MALQGFIQDFEVFLRELVARFDDEIDVSPGSPFDLRVIQPTLRRIGTDPFSIDVETFILDRLNQEFPDVPTRAGDAITDALIKPLRLLLDPLVRENARVKNVLSFKDPSTLTLEEADALGANLFATREMGDRSRGSVRVYFSTPQKVAISPANFSKSRDGLRFFPDSTQAIRSDEMLLNVEGALYYFDVNTVAEGPGDQYNIGPDEIVSIANLSSAVRVTNKRRFRFGSPAEDAPTFVDRAGNELTERSLVSDRGIGTVLPKTFPDITRLVTIGLGDPEMHRDVLEGGGLGPIIAGGALATPVADGEARRYSRRISIATVETPGFFTRVGPVGRSSGWVITLFSAGAIGSTPQIRDYTVTRVIDDRTLEVSEQLLDYAAPRTGPWILRRKSLTLSKIPGGILFPDTPGGTVEVVDNEVHIGGCYDVYLRGLDLDSTTLQLTKLTDDSPILKGIRGSLSALGAFTAIDVVLGVDYAVDDALYTALTLAVEKDNALQILDGSAAGVYSLLSIVQTPGASPIINLRNAPAIALSNLRWRLLDVIDVNLSDPKELRVDGSTAKSILGTKSIDLGTPFPLASYGVVNGDTLRLLDGPDAGDLTIVSIGGLFGTFAVVDREMNFTRSNLRFEIFQGNADGPIKTPLIRVTDIDVLDTSGQPIGTKVPFAQPIGVVTQAFANVGQGVKVDVDDAMMGVVGIVLPSFITTIDTLTLRVRYNVTTTNPYTGGTVLDVTFSGASLTPQQVVNRINTAAGFNLAVLTADNRLGLLPQRGTTSIVAGDGGFNNGTLLTALFGGSVTLSTRSVRSQTVSLLSGGWTNPSFVPAIDPILDVIQILDGVQIGFFSGPTPSSGELRAGVGQDFTPEANRHIYVGARSIGTARVYFIEPTSVEIDRLTRFSFTSFSGTELGFIADPTNRAVKIPAPPAELKPKDGRAPTTTTWRSPSLDFIRRGIKVGDILVIDFLPLIGTTVLADPVPNLNGLNVVLALNGVERTVTFIHDSVSIAPAHVTLKGVVDQINAQVGSKIARIGTSGKLELESTIALTVRRTGTANAALGFGALSADIRNESPNHNERIIGSLSTLTPTDLTMDSSAPVLVTALSGDLATFSDITRQQFTVYRPKSQRISVTEMAANVEASGLFFWDVQLMSEGTGDIYNIDDQSFMTVEGYRSDGYFLTSDDPDLTFSTVEKPRLHVSRSILPFGVNDDPTNALELSDQNLQISYDRSSLVAAVQAFVTAETERVINASPLVRHLVPYFVRIAVSYIGGAKERDVLPVLQAYVQTLAGSDSLDSSAIQKILSDNGATSVDNPLELVAVVHDVHRRVHLEISQDRLNTSRLAAFIPDVLTLTRRVR